ncbi:MAG: Fur family transcriptional regulator [Elainellaceae cyanobacterium]
MASSPLALLKDELNKRGFRLTSQRQEILHIFQTLPQGDHLSAEELYNTLQHKGLHISLSTVYRTLHVMTYMGILRELELAEGHKHYELNLPVPGQHHHLVCMQCNRTLEFKDDFATQIGAKQAEAAGHALLDCQLTIYVICTEALEAGWNHALPRDWVCDRPMHRPTISDPSS